MYSLYVTNLLDMLDIPRSMMPRVCSSSEVYGHTKTTIFAHEVPIAGIAGDQQAALFGQQCTEPGMMKNTYGTGCFLLMNCGNKPIFSKDNLLTTIGWQLDGKVTYALEGSIFVGGSVVQWLRDGLRLIHVSSEIEALAASVADTGGVYFVPALTGLGAPWWDQNARGTITGLSRGTTAAHIARAALEGIAFQTYDIAEAMEKDAGLKLRELKVDGGASRNNLLMQFQSDILRSRVVARQSPKPPPAAPPTSQVSQWAIGKASTTSAGSGRPTDASSRNKARNMPTKQWRDGATPCDAPSHKTQ